MRNRRDVLIASSLLLALAAGGTADAAVHAGDKLDVTVFNHPELSVSRTVDAAGNISVPVAGSIAALNREPDQVAASVRSRLLAYVRNVAVQVQLQTQNDSIFVAGGPNGVIKYAPGMTVSSIADRLQVRTSTPSIDALNAHAVSVQDVSAGPLDLANGPVDFHTVRILREGREMGPFDLLAMRAAGQAGPALVPNDTVQLAYKPVAVTIAGDVAKPGTAYLDRNEPLSEAMNQVGGPAASASLTNITLTRDGAPQNVSLGSEAFTQPGQNGDRIVVAHAPRVDVLGNVAKPGDTLLRGGTTLVSAIYYAGGPIKYANLKAVSVTHGGVRHQYNLANLQKGGTGDNPTLSDGDTVLVPQGSTFEWSSIWSAIGAFGLFGIHL